jgi:hypothetical protein
MNQLEFAKHMGVGQSTVTKWKHRGWLVMAGDCVVDVERSKARLLEKRGTLGDVGKREGKKASPWRLGPHCKTNRAHEQHRRWNGG